ncbi:MAG: PstS family phosphate ABC transporter substrate-binding protein [Opitutales bacterium]
MPCLRSPSQLLIVFCVATLSSASSRGQSAGEQVFRIGGSDLLGPALTEVLTDWAAGRDGIAIDLSFPGSLPALDNLRAGNRDLCLIAVPDGDNPPAPPYKALPFAYQVVLFGVNAENPIREISLPRLAGVFGRNEANDFNRWGDLGLRAWETRSIKPVVGGRFQGLAQALFMEVALTRDAFKQSVNFLESADRIEAFLLTDNTALGLMAAPPAASGIRVLSLARDGDSPAYAPTEENVHFSDYPIRLPFLIVFPEARERELRPLIRLLLSNRVAGALREAGISPVPDGARQRLAMEIDLQG